MTVPSPHSQLWRWELEKLLIGFETGMSFPANSLYFGSQTNLWTWRNGPTAGDPLVMSLNTNGSLVLQATGIRPAFTFQQLTNPATLNLGGWTVYNGYNSAGVNTTFGYQYCQFSDVTDGSEDFTFVWNGMTAGTVTQLMSLNGSALTVTPMVASTEFCSNNNASFCRLSGGGPNQGANIELYGSSSGQPNNAFYDAANHYFRSQAGVTGLTVTGAGTGTFAGNCNADAFVCNAGGIYFIGDTAAALGTAAGKAGNIYLRPQGYNVGTNQVYVGSDGAVHLSNASIYMDNSTVSGTFQGAGTRGKPGQSAGYAANWINFHWNGTNHLGYVDGTYTGYLTPPSDYRIKKDVENLNSTWENVKALRPISYTQAEFNPPAERHNLKELNERGEEVPRIRESLFKADDIKRWGFIAHELQEALLPSAADGEKDGEQPQCPYYMPILAALTKTLQEAMQRIEALEAKL